MKKIEKIPLKIKNGFIEWNEGNHKEIRSGITMAEAGVLILAEKLNEIIDHLNEKEK